MQRKDTKSFVETSKRADVTDVQKHELSLQNSFLLICRGLVGVRLPLMVHCQKYWPQGLMIPCSDSAK